MRTIALCGIMWAFCVLVWVGDARGALPAPAAASPGSVTRVAPIAERCPVFSWGAVAGAGSYQLLVYRFDDPRREMEPVLRQSLPGSVRSWTPPLDRCLEAGGRYAWVIRGSGDEHSSDWSKPRLFEIVAGSLREPRAPGRERESSAPREGPSNGPTRWPRATIEATESPPGESPTADAPAAPEPEIGIWSEVPDTSNGIQGIGVFGQAGETGYTNEELSVGVKGRSTAQYGIGVKGEGEQGVVGTSNTTFGAGGWFEGTGAAQGLRAEAVVCCNGANSYNYAAEIWNFAKGTDFNPDALALGLNLDTPGSDSNFIGFFDWKFNSGPRLIGQMEGNGLGGVHFTGSAASVTGAAADFAEYLLRLDPAEPLAPGDVVGLHGARVGHRTAGADRAMVVSERPLVLGGVPDPKESERFAPVALVGQVAVKVRGPVAVGDLLVPSGAGDGTALAVADNELTSRQARLLIGRALEPVAGDEEETQVKTIVGLPDAAVHAALRGAERKAQRFEVLAATMLFLGIGLVVGRVLSVSVVEARGDAVENGRLQDSAGTRLLAPRAEGAISEHSVVG